jgi:hypothetical protein
MKLFEVDNDVRKRALQLFDRTEESFDDDVQAIKKWLHTQKHLPEIMGMLNTKFLWCVI